MRGCATLVYAGFVIRNYFTKVDHIPQLAMVIKMVAVACTPGFDAASPDRILS